jgi:YjbR
MPTKPTTMQALLRYALRLPDTADGVACAGTALESRTVKRGNKAFLFLRATEARLKLGPSQAEAAALAAKEPGRYTAGAHGWVLVKFDGKPVPLDVLQRWVQESHSLLGSGGTPAKKASPKRKAKSSKPR